MPSARAHPRIALATPPGEGGIHVLLLHGPGAPDLAEALVRRRSRRPAPAGLALGSVIENGVLLDEVLVARPPVRPPDEPWVEIHCHGGPAAARAVRDAFVRAGARPAAWHALALRLSLRLDRLRQRALLALPGARSRLEAAILSRQAGGALSRALAPAVRALEAYARSGDEDHRRAFLRAARPLLDAAPLARALERPPLVVLAGPPNAGKSSLLNALLGRERALVDDEPGTTRDPIVETALLRGVPVRLADTAGLARAPGGPVEAEGVRRARDLLARADALAFLLAPGQKGRPPDGPPAVAVASQADRPGGRGRPGTAVSARTGEGLPALRRTLLRALGLPERPAPRPPPPWPGEVAALLERAAAEAGPSGAAEACRELGRRLENRLARRPGGRIQ